jgi:hypothetical protein
MVASSLRRLTLGCTIVALAGVCSPAMALRITELMASNAMTIADEDGTFSDWLELHNETGAPVNVLGHYLTDDAAVLTKWQLPSVVIPAGGYLLVWASNKNRTSPQLHTNFALSTGGDYLAVVAPNGTTILHQYAPQYPPQIADVSYGLASDLSTERCFLDPTPGAANDESRACAFVAAVQFSPVHGFYSAPVSVTISTPTPGATIRYTTDGSDPSETHGTIYSGPVSITTTTPLRAVAYLPGVASTKTATQTYIFLDDVLAQSAATIPPGYPVEWGSHTAADYDMDPRIVNDPAYSTEIRAGLQAIPTLSLVTDVANLFDAQTGIYVNTFGRGDAWQRPASAELIPAGGGTGFQKNCGIRIQGETSRAPSNKKYSLSLRFRGQYDGDLSFPLFAGAPVDTFHTLRLNARHQGTWHSAYGGDPEKALYVQDNFARETMANMGHLSTHFTYVHLYLNGIYWGLYSLHEVSDEDFLSSYMGGEPEDWDVFKDGPLDAGTRDAADALAVLLQQNLAVPANYNAVLAVIDVDNLIDYMLMNFYIGNRDWFANWYTGRLRVPTGKWMWFAWDSEFVLGNYREAVVGGVDGPLGAYGRLKADSAEFRLRFADRVHKHLFNDGALTPDQASARLVRNTDQVQSAVIGESARWGDKLHPTRPYTRDEHWLVEKQRLLLEYFPRRTDTLLDQLRAAGLYPSVAAPTFNQHGGDFLPGFALTMSAPTGTIYYTLDGSDPRVSGGGVAPGALAYGGPIPLSTSVTASARVLAGSTWSALTQASFAQASPVRVTEIMYNAVGGSNFDYIELANIGTGSVNLGGYALAEGITFTFPSYTLAAGAHVLVVKDQPTFETRYGTGLPIAGVYGGNLSDGGERLAVLDASAGPIQDFTYDDAWYPTTDGGGFSLVIRDATADRAVWDTAAGWRASTFSNGSPGAAELRACADGIDNDGDTLVDLADPGCASASQDHEDPACNDGVDNDGDPGDRPRRRAVLVRERAFGVRESRRPVPLLPRPAERPGHARDPAGRHPRRRHRRQRGDDDRPRGGSVRPRVPQPRARPRPGDGARGLRQPPRGRGAPPRHAARHPRGERLRDGLRRHQGQPRPAAGARGDEPGEPAAGARPQHPRRRPLQVLPDGGHGGQPEVLPALRAGSARRTRSRTGTTAWAARGTSARRSTRRAPVSGIRTATCSATREGHPLLARPREAHRLVRGRPARERASRHDQGVRAVRAEPRHRGTVSPRSNLNQNRRVGGPSTRSSWIPSMRVCRATRRLAASLGDPLPERAVRPSLK